MEHTFTSSTATLSQVCPICKKKHSMEFDRKAYQEGFRKYWHEEMLVQHAFPTFTPSQREFIVTGICSSCWDKLGEEGE